MITSRWHVGFTPTEPPSPPSPLPFVAELPGDWEGDCRPLECGNVALTTDNLTALRVELDHVDDELAVRPSLPPLLVHRLRRRREQIARFLDRHTWRPGDPPHRPTQPR